MYRLDSYLNFDGQAEEAFTFYKSVFGGEFDFIQRYKDAENMPDKEKLSAEEGEKIMHVSLPIGNNVLMGSDIIASMDATKLVMGNNVVLSIYPDTKAEADRLFGLFSEGGTIETPLADTFWGDYYGVVVDKFGIKWMIDTKS